jgi:hypothetical protein
VESEVPANVPTGSTSNVGEFWTASGSVVIDCPDQGEVVPTDFNPWEGIVEERLHEVENSTGSC